MVNKLPFLNLNQNGKQYDLEQAFNQLNELKSHRFFAASRRDLIDLMMGMYNLSVETQQPPTKVGGLVINGLKVRIRIG